MFANFLLWFSQGCVNQMGNLTCAKVHMMSKDGTVQGYKKCLVYLNPSHFYFRYSIVAFISYEWSEELEVIVSWL